MSWSLLYFITGLVDEKRKITVSTFSIVVVVVVVVVVFNFLLSFSAAIAISASVAIAIGPLGFLLSLLIWLSHIGSNCKRKFLLFLDQDTLINYVKQLWEFSPV